MPDEATLGLRRQVTRRTQIVRQRSRLKTIVQSILHAHLVPQCPHADLFGPRGRSWLMDQPLPPDEGDAVARHLREYDRLTEDLRVVERELAREARADPNVTRLNYSGRGHGGRGGTGCGVRSCRALRRPGPSGRLPGLEPSVHQSGERPTATWAHHQAGAQPRSHYACRSGLAGVARARSPARLLPAGLGAPGPPRRSGGGRPQAGGDHLASADPRRGLRLGAPGAPRQEAARPGAPLGRAGASWTARCGLRVQFDPDAPRGATAGRAG
jgi:hypothetical protein